ncbi:MAG TPA: IS630 family transposase [Actinocrinis sp.]|uniref:IS630 family transposase n=1 Tax=Actinocrinis sp. TaxID=1920516 RepID=UPI002DDD807B|nr:IS630 family transposase [Actinocrinis sp.]HEV2344125.1 IS630 family transposase [Actinocrinis sp.]
MLASPFAIELTEAERTQLEQLAASRVAWFGRVQRASVILALADGASNAAVACETGRHIDTVRVLAQTLRRRAPGRAGRPAPPAGPATAVPEDKLRIIAAATGIPPAPASTRTHRLLAERLRLGGLAVSASQIGRILGTVDLKPHLVRGWLTRPADPQFFTCATEVCTLYRGCPPNAVVISVGEKTGITARSRKHPDQPGRPGQRTRREFEYVRHGTVSIIAALNVRSGQVITERTEKNNAETFIGFLRLLDQSIPENTDIHLVMDNGSPHVVKKTKAWLAAHPRFHTHHTPKHASWLNQVELFFSTLTRRRPRRGQFASRDELAARIDEFVLNHDKHEVKPYRWAYGPTTAPRSKPRKPPKDQRSAALVTHGLRPLQRVVCERGSAANRSGETPRVPLDHGKLTERPSPKLGIRKH